jgi:hypothetical protein
MLNTLNWITVMKTKEITKDQEVQDQSKREFLRKSSYAAYMAPAMLTLVVDTASASCSHITNKRERQRCERHEQYCAENPNGKRC